MRNLKIILFTAIIGSFYQHVFSQDINWESLREDQKHIITANAGWDYGVVSGIGYGYQLKSKLPTLVTVSYSFPSGENLFDDFKAKSGGKMRIYRIRNVQFSAGINGIYRRYKNPLVQLQNFGAEIQSVAGYYKAKWFVAGEVTFDQAILTHFKHSSSFTEFIYNNSNDGWFRPSTGGNFQFGLQSGYSLKRHDITFKIGRTISQYFRTSPLIPYYVQLGYNFKIESR